MLTEKLQEKNVQEVLKTIFTKEEIEQLMNATKEKYLIELSIGDKDGDGHGVHEVIQFESNYPLEDLQTAYKETCRRTGIQLHQFISHRENNFTGQKNPTELFINYEDDKISNDDMNTLIAEGFIIPDDPQYEFFIRDEEDDYQFSVKSFQYLLFWYIQLSMPKDFTYKVIKGQSFNKDLFANFAYGLFFD